MKNRTEYLEALYGIWFAGLVAVPVNAKLHVKEAAWIMKDAGTQLAFVTDQESIGLRELVHDNLKTLISADQPEFAALYDAQGLAEPAVLDCDDLVWLFYTSGTTGKPKGVMISANNILSMSMAYFCDVDPVARDDAILYAAPMSHGAGIYNFMHVMKGARHVVPLSGAFDPEEIFPLASALRNISMFAAPTMVKRLVDHAKATGLDGEGIKTITYAGGPMYIADILEANAVLGDRFVQVYGQGECPMGITSLSRAQVSDRKHANWRSRLGSVGTAQSPVLVRIADQDGANLPVGEIGEILVRGPIVMLGYWQNEAATADTIRDGWLWTGDMGCLDEDGFVTLHDRSKDMIISGGSNVYPREVEEVLLAHPNVAEVAVVGQSHQEWGEVVVAFVVSRGEFDAALLDAYCLENIARFKRPKNYIEISELPKNNYGKVLKTELRAQLKRVS